MWHLVLLKFLKMSETSYKSNGLWKLISMIYEEKFMVNFWDEFSTDDEFPRNCDNIFEQIGVNNFQIWIFTVWKLPVLSDRWQQGEKISKNFRQKRQITQIMRRERGKLITSVEIRSAKGMTITCLDLRQIFDQKRMMQGVTDMTGYRIY